jgi:DNA-binding NarL/FixJ family response regulator
MKTTVTIRVMSIGVRSPEARAFDEFLDQQPDIAVVGNCNELQKVSSMVWRYVPHVLLLYLRGTQLAADAVRNILAEVPSARLLLMVPTCATEQAVELIEGGAWGVLAGRDLGKQGLRAVRAIRSGEIWASRAVLSRIVLSKARHVTEQITLSKAMQDLTGREAEIVKLVQTGSSNKEIAARLQISDQTVKTHLHNIFSKLNITRRQKILSKLSG